MRSPEQPGSVEHFEALFARDPDPWRTRSRWYEARKRAVLLAALPHPRYARAYEPACGAGELTFGLASRCDHLIASDASPSGIAHARRRLAGLDSVRLEQRRTPEDWPEGLFDLVVVCEFGYYLGADDLDRLAALCGRSLAPQGVLVACHWRHDAADFLRRADEVHRVLGSSIGLARAVSHVEEDFLLDVWRVGGVSVAAAEGLA